MYKMIVSDLDESLLRTDGTVSPADIATIAKLRERGVKFVPNTGRGFPSLQPLLQAIGSADLPGEYVIAYNGGAIVANHGNQILTSTTLDFAVADRLFRLAAAHPDLGAHIYTLHHAYVYRPSASEVAYLASRGVDYTLWEADDLEGLRGHEIVKVIFANLDQGVREAFAQEVLATMGPIFTVTQASGRYVEFNPLGIDKGDAALALGEKLEIAPEEIIAMGDNLNDLAMIQKVGLGVSVANGVPKVQAAADLVLPVDHNHSPVTALYEAVFA